jgi:hypothetical protein
VRTDPPAALNEMAAVAARLPHAVFSGRTAAWLHGLDLPWKPLEVTVPDGHASGRASVLLRRSRLTPQEVSIHEGLRVTTPLRTVTDLGRKLKTVEGVIALDMALHAGLVPLSDLRAFVARHGGAKGVARLRAAVELADAGAESPMETRLRLLLCRAGLPRPESQVELLDEGGRFLGRTDLYYPEQRLTIEYDGGTHRDSLAEDDRRQNRILEANYRLLRFTADDVSKNPQAVVHQVAAALGVSARKPRGKPLQMRVSARKPVG